MLLGAKTKGEVREALAGYLCVMPWLLGLLLFAAGPIIASLVLSLTDYNIAKSPVYVATANYARAFVQDNLFWPSLLRTFTYTFAYVPIVVAGSLLLAVLLNQHLAGTNVFRTLFFVPHLTPAVALAVLWTWLLHPKVGPVNAILGSLGLPQPGWLKTESWALPSLIMINLWAGFGGNRMLLFLAGLQGVPQELYEAAEIDGAGSWAKFRAITVPMISPVVFLNAILGIIGALKVFTTAFIATEGGPNYATWFIALHIYKQAFSYYRMGYASALAWVLALIILAFSLVQFKLADRWVYYEAS